MPGDDPLKVFISYAHERKEPLRTRHADRVLELANWLRQSGFDADLDQYHNSPSEGWPAWMERGVEKAEFVVVVCTQAYLARWKDEEPPGAGLGVKWESTLSRQQLHDHDGKNTKFVPVIFGDANRNDVVPLPLRGSTAVQMDETGLSDNGKEGLLRWLTTTPPAEKPPLGGPSLPPRQAQPRRDKPTNFNRAGIVPNGRFVGRTEELERLHNHLNADNGSQLAIVTAAIVGLGGIGKTEVAKRYAFTYADEYYAHWWIIGATLTDDHATAEDASSEATLERAASSCREVLEILGTPIANEATAEQVFAAFRTCLDDGRRHLVILDDARDTSLINSLSPPPPSRLLVTTRRQDLPGHLDEKDIIHLEVLDQEAARDLLRAGRSDLQSEDANEMLDAVASLLGHHALACALANGYLRERRGCSLEDLHARLSERGLSEEAPTEKTDPASATAGYERCVRATLTLGAEELSEAARELLAASAFCAPDQPIPPDFLSAVCALDNEARQDGERELNNASIASISPEGFSVHTLVQHTVRESLRNTNSIAERVLVELANSLEGQHEDPSRWMSMERLVPHALAASEHTVNSKGLQIGGLLANQVGGLFFETARYDAALAAFRNAERIDRASFGNDHPHVAVRAINIGSVLIEKGDFDGALDHYKEAERISRSVFGDNHPQVATVVNNIGYILQSKGDLEDAFKRYEESERIDRAAFGDDHPNVAIRVNNIGSLLQDAGEYDIALTKYREAERIDRIHFGDHHPNVARDVNNVGYALEAKGDLKGALDRYRESERISRAVLGDDHPQVATSLNGIANILHANGDLEGALSLFKEAESIDRAAFGDDHPNVAVRINNIGQILQAKGNVECGCREQTAAFDIFLRKLGPYALKTCITASNIWALDVDPIARARELVGDEAAETLRAALVERYGSWPPPKSA